MERCPIHNVIKFGDPVRCLYCEPDQREALAERTPINADDMVDADYERFERVLARTYAEHSALMN
jgi:hypothetical protein